MKKIIVLTLVVILALAAFAGCAIEGQTTPAATEGDTSEPAAEAPAEEAEPGEEPAVEGGDKDKITVGISYLWLGDDYMKNMQNTFQTYAAANNIEIIEKSADSDGETQVKHLENFISTGVDAIIYQPVTATTGVTAVQEAMAKGIPVITVNTIVDGYDDWGKDGVWAASADARVAGLQMGELVAKLLNEKGTVAHIQGTFGSASSDDRAEGVNWILQNYPEIEIVFDDAADWARDQAYTLMSNWLATGTDIDAVIAASSEEAIGAMNAIEEAGLVPGKDIIIVTTDNSEECDGYIESGKIAGCCTHDSNFEALVAMEFVEQIVREGVTPAEQTRYIPHNMVTLENLSQFKGTMKSFAD